MVGHPDDEAYQVQLGRSNVVTVGRSTLEGDGKDAMGAGRRLQQ